MLVVPNKTKPQFSSFLGVGYNMKLWDSVGLVQISCDSVFLARGHQQFYHSSFQTNGCVWQRTERL